MSFEQGAAWDARSEQLQEGFCPPAGIDAAGLPPGRAPTRPELTENAGKAGVDVIVSSIGRVVRSCANAQAVYERRVLPETSRQERQRQVLQAHRERSPVEHLAFVNELFIASRHSAKARPAVDGHNGWDVEEDAMTVSSPQLTAAGATWVDGPEIGGWIDERLGPFGPSVGHAVPLGYAAYAVVPIVSDEDGEPFETLPALEPVLAALETFTQDQPVHTAMWDGWSWWYETGTTPAPARVGIYWDHDGPQPSPQEIERARSNARAEVAEAMVEYPDSAPLELPERRYYVWTGPLRSATAFHEWLHNPPSLIWPDDRAWFIGIPIYTFEIAIAGFMPVIEAILADPTLNARSVDTEYQLEGDD